METLNQYFAYYDDDEYSNVNDIFYGVSRELKKVHEQGLYVPNLSGDNIVCGEDNTFSFLNLESAANNGVDQRKNILAVAKMLVGAYLSLSLEYTDYSSMPDDFFAGQIDNICSSISSDKFDGEYVTSLFTDGSSEYYSDYLDRKKQNESLSSGSNVQGYAKVLANAASSLYQEHVFDEEDLNVSGQGKASLNVIFYPLLIGCAMVLTVVLSIIAKMIK